MLKCYIQEKPFEEKNLQTLIFFLFNADTTNYVNTYDYNPFFLNSTLTLFHGGLSDKTDGRPPKFKVGTVRRNRPDG